MASLSPKTRVMWAFWSLHRGVSRFFVASRGHHADVGGITPGSMPPNSRRLVEEGAAIIAFKLVRGGQFQVCMHCDVSALHQSKLPQT